MRPLRLLVLLPVLLAAACAPAPIFQETSSLESSHPTLGQIEIATFSVSPPPPLPDRAVLQHRLIRPASPAQGTPQLLLSLDQLDGSTLQLEWQQPGLQPDRLLRLTPDNPAGVTIATFEPPVWKVHDAPAQVPLSPTLTLLRAELPHRLRHLHWNRVTLFDAVLLHPEIPGSTPPRPTAFAIEKVRDGWRYTLRHRGGTERLTFDLEPPHTLNRWEQADGVELVRTFLEVRSLP